MTPNGNPPEDAEHTEHSPLIPRGQAAPSINSTTSHKGLTRQRGAAICVSMFTLIFIIPCNVTLMTTIQGAVSSDLDASELVSWFTSAYLIAVTSIMPLAGRLSQIFTARAYVLGSIIIQSFGLLFTAFANSFLTFIAGRVITGIGAAAVTPVAFLLVTELTSKENRGVFFGCINTAFTSGVACGAIFAGALEPLVGWRAIFWLQIPFCLAAATVAFLSIPPPPPSDSLKGHHELTPTVLQRLSSLDFMGITTLITGVVLLLYALSASTISYQAIILSFLSLTLFVLVEAHWAQDPVVPISVIYHRGNLLTGLATVGLMAARWSVLFYTPIYGISIRNLPATEAGILLIPTDIGFALGGIVVGYLHIRDNRSYYLPSLLAFLLFSLTGFSLALLSTAHSSLAAYLPASFANGFCAGAILNYTLAHVLYLTPPSTHVVVIPFIAMLRSLAGSFGSAISGGIFLRSLKTSLQRGFDSMPAVGEGQKQDLIHRLIGNPNLVYELQRQGHTSLFKVALHSYESAFRTMFICGAGIALATMAVQAGTGWKGWDSNDAKVVPEDAGHGQEGIDEADDEAGDDLAGEAVAQSRSQEGGLQGERRLP